jgi:hypothetical protein
MVLNCLNESVLCVLGVGEREKRGFLTKAQRSRRQKFGNVS